MQVLALHQIVLCTMYYRYVHRARVQDTYKVDIVQVRCTYIVGLLCTHTCAHVRYVRMYHACTHVQVCACTYIVQCVWVYSSPVYCGSCKCRSMCRCDLHSRTALEGAYSRLKSLVSATLYIVPCTMYYVLLQYYVVYDVHTCSTSTYIVALVYVCT